MSAWTSSLQSLTETLDAGGLPRAVGRAHAVDRVWPTGFDVLDEQPQRRVPQRRPDPARRPAGHGQDDAASSRSPATSRGRAVPSSTSPTSTTRTTMLIRLVALEAGLIGGVEAPSIQRIRAHLRGQPTAWAAACASGSRDTSGGAEALEIVREYSDRLSMHRSSGAQTDLDQIKETIVEIMREHRRVAPFVCIDYLQKIPMPGHRSTRTSGSPRVVEQRQGHGPRLRRPGALRGRLRQGGHRAPASGCASTTCAARRALAYEADTVLMLNNKYDVVARHHLVYDAGNVERFKHWAVIIDREEPQRRHRGRHGVPQALRPVPLRHQRSARPREARRRARLHRSSRRRPRRTERPGRHRSRPASRLTSALRSASSSPATLRVRLGSTWTPGPIVVETVTFLM